MQSYHIKRDGPLNKKEIKEKYLETKDEMREVLEWKKEEEERLEKDEFETPQAKLACNKALKKIARRIDSVNGMTSYWKNRLDGMSHFRASIELN